MAAMTSDFQANAGTECQAVIQPRRHERVVFGVQDQRRQVNVTEQGRGGGALVIVRRIIEA